MSTQLRGRVNGLMSQAHADLADLVAMKSVADPRQFPAEECERAADWIADAFTKVGFADTRLVETADGSKAVYGTRPGHDPAAPTVLLYAHYDVQPPLDQQAWRTPPFELTEGPGGRWYGRGAADCKGNIVMHLAALRALGDKAPVNLKLIVEGSEEQGTGGLEEYVSGHTEMFAADAILVCDTGNAAVGTPAVTVSLRGMVNVVVTVEALASEVHSGMFGGPAPDALAALVRILDSLRNAAGDTTITGLDSTRTWPGANYPPDQFRADAGLLDGVSLIGSGSVSDMLWARPAATILGIDCPPVVGSAAALQPHAAARLNLRIPPGTEPHSAATALEEQLRAAAPWGVHVSVTVEATGSPFMAATEGPAYAAMGQAMQEAFGKPMTLLGQGGSIPLCNVFAANFADAEIILMGVEEPQSLMHAPNESVDPQEIADMALTEALFLQRFAAPQSST